MAIFCSLELPAYGTQPLPISIALTQVKPAHTDVHYGPHARQVLDFYQARSRQPTPVIVAIHGGGWVSGDKKIYHDSIKPYLDAGISVAAINYRLVTQAAQAGVHPPVKWPLEDAARAVQFLRTKAKAWNLRPDRIGAIGASAGACSALWLLYHDDMAQPTSDDEVLRQSTRLDCAAVSGAQTTLDPQLLRKWIPNARYGGHAFGFTTPKNRDGGFQEFLDNRDKLLPLITEYSPLSHVTRDDPPVYLEYPGQNVAPRKGEAQTDPTHSAVQGLILAEAVQRAGVRAIIVYPGVGHFRYPNGVVFMIERLNRR